MKKSLKKKLVKKVVNALLKELNLTIKHNILLKELKRNKYYV